jgi:HEAT repeat protein
MSENVQDNPVQYFEGVRKSWEHHSVMPRTKARSTEVVPVPPRVMLTVAFRSMSGCRKSLSMRMIRNMSTDRDRSLPDGKALRDLASSDRARVGDLIRALLDRRRSGSLAELDASESLARALADEWEALGREGASLVPALSAAFQHPDTGLLHAEIVGMALAQQGEDGMGELVGLLDSDDFVLRHKAVIGLGTLGRRGRWAVPALVRLLERESQTLVVWNVIDALGRIGGQPAIDVLTGLRPRLPPDVSGEVLATLDQALALARTQES